MKLMYFAWLRERVGRDAEQIEIPGNVVTVADLVGWLKTRGEEYANAFNDEGGVRAAIDRRYAGRDALIAGAREIAFFPPMTGG